MNHLKHLVSSAELTSVFLTRTLESLLFGNRDKNSEIEYKIHYFFDIYLVLKVALIKFIAILLMLVKLATPGLLKRIAFPENTVFL